MVIDHCMFTMPFGIFSLIVYGIVSSIAILANGFIVFVNSYHWLQTRKLVPCDLLLTCLGTFRFLTQCLCLVDQYIFISNPVTYQNSYAYEIVGVLWAYFILANFSCLTSLTIFYCVKVTNFANPLFFWLKSSLNRLVPKMLTMPLILYMIFYLPPAATFLVLVKSVNLTGNLQEKESQNKTVDEYFSKILYPLQLSFTAINFSICLTAFFLLLFSLWQHMRNLKKSNIGVKDLSTQLHINVIKPQVLSLCLYILNFVFLTVALSSTFGNTNRLIADTVICSCSSAHSIILISSNPKLRRACARILRIRGGAT